METEPWQQPEIYVQARGVVDAVLLRHGYRAHTERYDPHAFGSAFAIYRRASDDHHVGLTWDGRDSALYLGSSDDGQNYRTVAESSLGLDKADAEKVAAEIALLVAAAESLAVSRNP